MSQKEYMIEVFNLKVKHHLEKTYFFPLGFGLIVPFLLGVPLILLSAAFTHITLSEYVSFIDNNLVGLSIYPFYLFLIATPFVFYGLIRLSFYEKILSQGDEWKKRINIDYISDETIKNNNLKTEEEAEDFMWAVISKEIRDDLFRVKYLFILPYIIFAINLFIHVKFLK